MIINSKERKERKQRQIDERDAAIARREEQEKQREIDRVRKAYEWHPFFTWKPVELVDTGDTVVLQRVWRRKQKVQIPRFSFHKVEFDEIWEYAHAPALMTIANGGEDQNDVELEYALDRLKRDKERNFRSSGEEPGYASKGDIWYNSNSNEFFICDDNKQWIPARL